ncbi:MAG: sugar ABC transporter permease [SAR202 cluster bacterium]|nr:sugar ABC transporter permease [SAR202 cluster bacterium]HIN27441.1 sugar ABC transporter permease [Candidatus Poribacteria bacterium]
MLPTLIILIGLAIFPLGWAGVLAFRVENLFRPDIGKWVGLRNFKYLLTDDTFWKSIRLTLVWCLCVVSIQMVLGFMFAMMLDTRARVVGLLRTLIVIPVFISPIAMGLTWQFMFEPVTGVINYFLELLGLPGGTWHTSTDTALMAVMIADIWQWTPFVTLILLAGMQGISPEVIEAARLDRVRGWKYITKIVIPLIWPVVMVVLLLRLVDSIRIFDLVFVITRGGPGTATLVASVYDYTIFQAGRLGVMAAYGFLILIVINLVVILFLRLLYRQEKEARQVQKA